MSLSLNSKLPSSRKSLLLIKLKNTPPKKMEKLLEDVHFSSLSRTIETTVSHQISSSISLIWMLIKSSNSLKSKQLQVLLPQMLKKSLSWMMLLLKLSLLSKTKVLEMVPKLQQLNGLLSPKRSEATLSKLLKIPLVKILPNSLDLEQNPLFCSFLFTEESNEKL